ncbi:sugar phosphate isomerase/epimerase family protein [Muricomes intestini]|uniref:sugar phosphate isomerase/epimerase family protein n=1 Tax=Muricomes intestini TaxID=1796634 RepID=UPI0026ACDE64
MKTSASISVQFNNIFAPFPGKEYQQALKWVKESGFDAAELIISDPGLLDISSIQNGLAWYSLKVSTISTGQAAGMEGLAMTSMSEHIRALTRRRLEADVDFAVEFGRANVTVGLIRGKGGDSSPEIERELLIRELSAIGEYADKKGIVINLEPINRYEASLINSTESGWELLRDIGSPSNIGLLYDTFHSNIEDRDMQGTIHKVGESISHVHLADSNRRLPGEGHIDFRSITRTLQEIGYAGYVSLEVLNLPNAAHVIHNAGKQVRELF